jgi:hypothetical protein
MKSTNEKATGVQSLTESGPRYPPWGPSSKAVVLKITATDRKVNNKYERNSGGRYKAHDQDVLQSWACANKWSRRESEAKVIDGRSEDYACGVKGKYRTTT